MRKTSLRASFVCAFLFCLHAATGIALAKSGAGSVAAYPPASFTLMAQATAANSDLKMISIPGFKQEGIIIGLKQDDGIGVINIGTKEGVQIGDLFAVVRVKDTVKDPKSGKVIRALQDFVGAVEAVSVFDGYSDVKLIKNAKYIKEGDSVRRKPTTPSGLKVENKAARNIELNWDLSYEPEVEGYKIYRSSESKDGPFTHIDSITKGSATNFIDDGDYKHPIEEGKQYFYRITSYSSIQKESDPSETIAILSKSAPPPPGGLSVSDEKIRALSLKWTPSKDEDVQGYKIYRSESKDGEMTMIADLRKRETSDYTDYGDGRASDPKLNDQTVYYYAIAAYNIFKTEGEASKPISGKTLPPPSTPEGFAAKGMQPRMVPLTWKTHDDPEVKGYMISRSDNFDGPFEDVADIQGRGTSNYVDTGTGLNRSKSITLKDGSLYFYKIQAYNWVNAKSEPSQPVSVLTKPVPFPPENFTATSNRPRQVPIEWRKLPDVTIKEYEIFRSDSQDGKFDRIGKTSADKPYYLDEKLEDGKAYYYKIRALDRFDIIGEFSDVLEAKTKKLPAKVSGLRWEIVTGEPMLMWDANPEEDIKEYIIYVSGFFGWSKEGSSPKNSYVIKGLRSGSSGDYRVSAIDVDGLEGDTSDKITVRP